jgi:hypothetical protein
VTGIRIGRYGVRVLTGAGDIALLKLFRADTGPQPVSRIPWLLRGVKTSGEVNLITYFHLVPMLRMSGALPLLDGVDREKCILFLPLPIYIYICIYIYWKGDEEDTFVPVHAIKQRHSSTHS